MTKADIKPAKVVGACEEFLKALSEAVGDSTLGLQQVRLLTSLYIHGALNQGSLHDYTGVERSANSRNIARLGSGQWIENRATGAKRHEAGAGMVEAYEEPQDRRQKMVRLTPHGKAVMDAAALGAAMKL
jgi:DNA-binding MarR family transcriptional regulator